MKVLEILSSFASMCFWDFLWAFWNF